MSFHARKENNFKIRTEFQTKYDEPYFSFSFSADYVFSNGNLNIHENTHFDNSNCNKII